jgi:hypothetical protein
MTLSYTVSDSATFTITHARHMAAKVATDLKRIQRFYGEPSDADISGYEDELALFLRHDYLGTVTYGFRRNGAWIEPTLRYSARDLAGGSANDEDPGRVRPGADITGAGFYSYLTYSSNWYRLSDGEKDTFRRLLPFQRPGAPEPTISGYLYSDRTYSAGGRALDRATVRAI